MFALENLLEEKPRLFRKMVLEDGTIVNVYMPHDRYFGWSIVEKDGKRGVVPAIGKLQYPFEIEYGNDEVRIVPQLTYEAQEVNGGELLIKYDGFWTMAWEFGGKVHFRTRQKPFIGERAATARVVKDVKLAEKVEKFVKDGYWPMFEVWGPGLEDYAILHGDTRVADLARVLGLKDRVIPTVLGAFDVRNERWLDYEEVVDVFGDEFYVAEPLSRLGFGDEWVPMHPRNLLKAVDWMEMLNLKRGMRRADYYVKDGKVVIRVPEFDEPNPVLEGAVLFAHDGAIYRGFKLKPYTVFVIDTYTKKRPPLWRIRQEVVKVISDIDELEAPRRYDEFIGEVVKYLSEDYEMTKELKKEVSRHTAEMLAEIILKNHPEMYTAHPRELAKLGWDKRFIGTFVRARKEAAK